MATQKQIAANRLNARKSTGPRSAEGKARSSMNALRSGIDAETQVIKHLEEFADLNRLKMEYGDRFHPNTPEQRALVDILIDSEWLLRRFRRIEAEVLLHGTNNTLNQTILAASFLKTCDSLTRLQRRIDSTQRNFRNALHELERLQHEEVEEFEEFEEAALTSDPEAEPASIPSLVSPRNQTPKPQSGFVPPTRSQPPREHVSVPSLPATSRFNPTR